MRECQWHSCSNRPERSGDRTHNHLLVRKPRSYLRHAGIIRPILLERISDRLRVCYVTIDTKDADAPGEIRTLGIQVKSLLPYRLATDAISFRYFCFRFRLTIAKSPFHFLQSG